MKEHIILSIKDLLRVYTQTSLQIDGELGGASQHRLWSTECLVHSILVK